MDLDFDAWIKYGYDKGWISDVFCNTHDGPPMSDEEMQESGMRAETRVLST